MSPAPSPTSPPGPTTPIFDEVDGWWRDGGHEPAPSSMLSFPGASRDRRRPVRSPGSTSAPRHLLG
ncbi:MAG TPA: hypothetical protein VGH76_13840 [Actinomycetospora sp.]|jgi:hypothetical protein|uniref:hypothetical protein n=1 Tax=Actinomycetospora sp. TaxID=1872135 RepID=UPI002F3F7DFD